MNNRTQNELTMQLFQTMRKLGIAILILYTNSKISAQNSDYQQKVLEIDTTINQYVDSIGREQFYPNAVLNVFFAEMISKYIVGSGELPLAKGYAILNNKDNRLYIGKSLYDRTKVNEQLNHVFQLGYSTEVKQNFSNLLADGLGENTGFDLRYTFIGNGTINLGKNRKSNFEQILTFRNGIVSKEKIDASSRIIDIFNHYDYPISEIDSTAKESLFQKLNKSVVDNMLVAEAKSISLNKNYSYYWVWWASLEGFYSLNGKAYNILNTLPGDLSKRKVKPHSIAGSISLLIESPRFGAFYGVLGVQYSKRNNVEIDELKPFDLVNSINISGSDTLALANLETTKIYVGQFEEFDSFDTTVECTYFFPGKLNWVGVRASLLNRIGTRSSFDWILGLPISLLDNDKKPKVNFELQWKEINRNHSLGISIGVPIGSTFD